MPLNLSCRYYEEVFPPVETVVALQITKVEDAGAFGELLEYDHKEALLLSSGFSRTRIRSIHKIVRPGMKKVCTVVRVTEEKDYVDLSMLHTTTEEKAEFKEKYAKAKEVNSILTHVAEILGYTSDEQLESLYDKTAWHFDRESGEPGIGAYDAFKQSVEDPSVFDECDGIDEQTKTILINYIARRLASKEVRLYSEVSVSCFTSEGIDAIKAALKAGLALSTDTVPIKINLVRSPVYAVSLTTRDPTAGMKLVNYVIENIKCSIIKSRGTFEISVPPRCTSMGEEAFRDDSGYLSDNSHSY